MDKEYLFKASFYVEGLQLYNLVLTNEYQLVLEVAYPGMDSFGHEYPSTMYKEAADSHLGMLVYRKAVKIFLEYIHSHTLNYFWFSTDYEEVRRKLYRHFADLLKKHQYICSYSTEDIFYFARKKDRF